MENAIDFASASRDAVAPLALWRRGARNIEGSQNWDARIL